MRSLTLALDALPSLREATAAGDVDVAAAATLADLAGVDAVRLSVNEDLKPVREEDVRETRRAARRLELRMPPRSSLLKVALEARPDGVVLAAEGRDGRSKIPTEVMRRLRRSSSGAGVLSRSSSPSQPAKQWAS